MIKDKKFSRASLPLRNARFRGILPMDDLYSFGAPNGERLENVDFRILLGK
jgi:hypothetical protein